MCVGIIISNRAFERVHLCIDCRLIKIYDKCDREKSEKSICMISATSFKYLGRKKKK